MEIQNLEKLHKRKTLKFNRKNKKLLQCREKFVSKDIPLAFKKTDSGNEKCGSNKIRGFATLI